MAHDARHYASLYDERYFSGQRSFFYRLTGGYRDLKAVFDGYAADVRRYASHGRLLDVGCAFGYLLQRFQHDFETYGLDVSDHAIAEARRNAPASALRVHNVLDPFPFDDATFDVVTMTDLLEHVPDTQRILAEVARVCRPGAILYVTTPTRNLVRRLVYWIPDRLEHHTNLLSFRQLGRHLDDAGFHVVERFTSLSAAVGTRFRNGAGPEQTYIARRRAR